MTIEGWNPTLFTSKLEEAARRTLGRSINACKVLEATMNTPWIVARLAA